MSFTKPLRAERIVGSLHASVLLFQLLAGSMDRFSNVVHLICKPIFLLFSG